MWHVSPWLFSTVDTAGRNKRWLVVAWRLESWNFGFQQLGQVLWFFPVIKEYGALHWKVWLSVAQMTFGSSIVSRSSLLIMHLSKYDVNLKRILKLLLLIIKKNCENCIITHDFISRGFYRVLFFIFWINLRIRADTWAGYVAFNLGLLSSEFWRHRPAHFFFFFFTYFFVFVFGNWATRFLAAKGWLGSGVGKGYQVRGCAP